MMLFKKEKIKSFSRTLFRERESLLGWTLIEVLVSLGILLAGIVGIALYFPSTIETRAEAGHIAEAILLANRKAQEVRRDTDINSILVDAIANQGNLTDPIRFPEQPIMTYQFGNFSLLDPVDDAGDVRDDIPVPRVIVRYATQFRPTAEVLYELRFDL